GRHTRSARDWSSDVCSSDLKCCEDESDAEIAFCDQACEAVFGAGADGHARIKCRAGREGRRLSRGFAGLERRGRAPNVQWASQQVLRIRAKLVADAFCWNAGRVDARSGSGLDDDLVPADPVRESRVAVVEPDRRGASLQLVRGKDDLEPGRTQTGDAGREPDR